MAHFTTLLAFCPGTATAYTGDMTNQTTATESVSDRLARLGLAGNYPEVRLETLALAAAAGVDDTTFRALATATRVSRTERVLLPRERLEGLSRGKGWARQGRGDSAVWGDREDGGYRVGPGRWVVGGSDGFARKSKTEWVVEHVTVGDATWTVAS